MTVGDIASIVGITLAVFGAIWGTVKVIVGLTRKFSHIENRIADSEEALVAQKNEIESLELNVGECVNMLHSQKQEVALIKAHQAHTLSQMDKGFADLGAKIDQNKIDSATLRQELKDHMHREEELRKTETDRLITELRDMINGRSNK